MIYTFIGYLVSTAVSFLILAWAYCFIQEHREAYKNKQYYRAMKEARIDLGRIMMQEAYWLTGINEEAFKTYHLVGKTLLTNGSIDIDRFRTELKTYEVK